MTAADLHHRLCLLQVERLDAREAGLTAYEPYRRDLDMELAECCAAFIGAAVTEIASLRAEMSGPQLG